MAPPIPPLKQYLPALMDYARQARWGKQHMPRWRRRPHVTRMAA